MKPYTSIPIGCALAVSSFTAGAYESDLHYGLTSYLGSQAGLSAQQSHELARGNELMDTGTLDAKQSIAYELCWKGNLKASFWTRHFHFRAQKVPPAAPKDRPVDNNDVFAVGQTNSVIQAAHDDKADYLFKLGQALHGWQDSYSHAGVSNTAIRCPDDYIWSHPGKEGVLSHKVDLTFEDVDKCMTAGKTTYDFLLEYLKSVSLQSSPADWTALEPKVHTFCTAETKAAKADWLRDNGVPQSNEIAKNTSLDNGGRLFFLVGNIDLGEKLPEKRLDGTTVSPYEQQVPGFVPSTEGEEFADLGDFENLLANPRATASPEAEALTRGFLQAWLTSPPDKLPEAMVPYVGKSILSQDNEYISKLRRLRLKDQGPGSVDKVRMNAQGVNPDDYVTFDDKNWPSALIPVRGRKSQALVAEDGGRLIVIAILRSAPNEVLMLEATTNFELKSMSSIVFH
jgi:hypothetical protein